jgi:hypothetical protein
MQNAYTPAERGKKTWGDIGEAKQVAALTDVNLQLRKDIRGKRGKGYERGHAIKGPDNVLVVFIGLRLRS